MDNDSWHRIEKCNRRDRVPCAVLRQRLQLPTLPDLLSFLVPPQDANFSRSDKPHKVLLQRRCPDLKLPSRSLAPGPGNIWADQLSHKFTRCSAGSVTDPTKSALQQKTWLSWELGALAENCARNPIATVTPFDAAQAIVEEDFEFFPVLHTERLRLIAIGQDGSEYCRVDPAFGFARNHPCRSYPSCPAHEYQP